VIKFFFTEVNCYNKPNNSAQFAVPNLFCSYILIG
jgi:hypothetical protein